MCPPWHDTSGGSEMQARPKRLDSVESQKERRSMCVCVCVWQTQQHSPSPPVAPRCCGRFPPMGMGGRGKGRPSLLPLCGHREEARKPHPPPLPLPPPHTKRPQQHTYAMRNQPPLEKHATASGTLNPLSRVLFILRSLYLCAIGPVPSI